MITLAIKLLMLVAPIIMFLLIWQHRKDKEKRRKHLEEIETAFNARRRMQEHLAVREARLRRQARRIRERVDVTSFERTGRTIYGPYGIRTEMRGEEAPDEWRTETSRLRFKVNERPTIDPDNYPDVGAIKILKGRKFKFDGIRWMYVTDVHEKIDFLTEDDMVIE